MATYEDLRSQQSELIRKALRGSFFIAGPDADPITSLTEYTAGPPVVIDLAELPEGWEDLGLLGTDGLSFTGDVTSSDVSSWGYTTPTRSDILSDTTTFTVTAQETKALSIGLFTGTDVADMEPAVNTGELQITKSTSPVSKYYRGLLLAVDDSDDGEIYIGRFFPRVKVTGRSDQAFGGGDDPILWGVNMQTFVDGDLGFSERYLFGGPGWNAKLAAMGLSA